MSLDLDEILNEGKRLSTKGGGDNNFLDNFVPMPEGDGIVIVRLLPPAKKGVFGRERNPFYVSTRTHKVNNKNLHCPRTLDKATGRWVGECPVCKYYSWLWKESEKPDKTPDEKKSLQAQARSIKPVERHYYNAIVRAMTNPATKKVEAFTGTNPRILSIGQMLHGKIIRGITGDEEMQEPALGDVTDYKTGRDFKIAKKMTAGNDGNQYPNYAESKFLEPSPLGTPEQIAAYTEGLHDLVPLRNVLSFEELKKQLRIHLGIEKDDKADDFDPSEFQKPSNASPVAVQVTETASVAAKVSAPAAKVEAKKEPEVDAAAALLGETDSLADDDFLETLKSM